MDLHASRSSSPTPLQAVSPERVNQQALPPHLGFDSSIASASLSSSVSVADKIGQFNTLAMQSKQLERKTADAALKRAMLGREEAETEARRYREEARQLKKQVEEGRDRERRVGERLETVMENYGRAKETHAHTQALWEKEIRRARKETFKSQSAIVKLQEELKAARAASKSAEDALEHERQRSKAREQEAFQARYALVGFQEALEQADQKIKMLEQERDAFKSLARSEEDVARIASEGRLPLPPPDESEEEEKALEVEQEGKEEAADATEEEDNTDKESEIEDTHLAVPKLRNSKRGGRSPKNARLSSVSLRNITSSAASEAEIDELTRRWQWEKQRADRAAELVEYLEAECHLRACSCMKKRPRTSLLVEPHTASPARKRPALDIADAGDRMILSEKAAAAAIGITSPAAKIRANMMIPAAKKTMHQDENHQQDQQDHEHSPKEGPRLGSAIFAPEEGVFRTVSQQIAEEMEEAVAAAAAAAVTAMPAEPNGEVPAETPAETVAPMQEDGALEPARGEATEADTTVGDVTADTAYTVDSVEPSQYARTPSVDPPAFAVLAAQRTSLLSLLDAPHRQDVEPPINFYVPTTPGPAPAPAAEETVAASVHESDACVEINMDENPEAVAPRTATSILVSSTSTRDVDVEMEEEGTPAAGKEDTQEEQSRVSDVTQIFAGGSQRPGEQPPADEMMHDATMHNEDAAAEQEEVTTQLPPPPLSRYLEETPTPTTAEEMVESHYHQHPPRPHTVTGMYATKTTTTKVPLRQENTDPSLAQRIMAAQRTPTHKTLSSSIYSDNSSSSGDGPTFDVNNPALTPTMTREQCLAQIRERRGRARSANGGSSSSSSSSGSGGPATTTASAPRRPVTPGKERREVSAPVGRAGPGTARRVRS